MVTEGEGPRENGGGQPSNPITQALIQSTWEHGEPLKNSDYTEAGSLPASCLSIHSFIPSLLHPFKITYWSHTGPTARFW